MRGRERVADERERVAAAVAAPRRGARPEHASAILARRVRAAPKPDELQEGEDEERDRRESREDGDDDPAAAGAARVDQAIGQQGEEPHGGRPADGVDRRGPVAGSGREREDDARASILWPRDRSEKLRVQRHEHRHAAELPDRRGARDRRSDRTAQRPPVRRVHDDVPTRTPHDPREPTSLVPGERDLERPRAREPLGLRARSRDPRAKLRPRSVEGIGEPRVRTLGAVRAQGPVDGDDGDEKRSRERERSEPSPNALPPHSCHRAGTLQRLEAALPPGRYGSSAITRSTAAVAAPEKPANTASTPRPITARTTAYSAIV